MAGRLDGVSLGLIAAGGGLVYAGVQGKSIPALLTGFIQGKPPGSAAAAAPLPGGTASVGTGTAAGAAANPSTLPSESAWVGDLLAALGAPATAANVASIEGWAAREGPWGTQGGNGYNPLNTELAEPGAGRDPQAPQIPEYTSVQQGIEATVSTIEGYPAILMALQSGAGLPGAAPPAPRPRPSC